MRSPDIAIIIIKGLTLVQLLFVILVIVVLDFGLARLVYLLLKKAKITKQSILVWLSGSVVLTALRALSYWYVLHRPQAGYGASMASWSYVAMLPEMFVCGLTGTCRRLFEPGICWPTLLIVIVVCNLIMLLPTLQIGIRRSVIKQAV